MQNNEIVIIVRYFKKTLYKQGLSHYFIFNEYTIISLMNILISIYTITKKAANFM